MVHDKGQVEVDEPQLGELELGEELVQVMDELLAWRALANGVLV